MVVSELTSEEFRAEIESFFHHHFLEFTNLRLNVQYNMHLAGTNLTTRFSSF